MPTARLFFGCVVAVVVGLVFAMALADLMGLDTNPTDGDSLRSALMVGVAVVTGSTYGAWRRSRQAMPNPEDLAS